MKGVFILFLVSLVRPSGLRYCFSHYYFYNSCLFSQSYFCAEADWELHVRIHSYNHLNSQRDFEGRHCDSLPDDPCENYFIFCLQFYEWSQTSNACQYRYLTANGPLEVRSGIIGGGGSSSSSATFSVGQNIFAQGVDNPLIYRGSGAWIVSATRGKIKWSYK